MHENQLPEHNQLFADKDWTTNYGRRDLILFSLFISLGSSYFLVMMDWLFFVTKASFFSSLSNQKGVEALLIACLVLFSLLAAVTLIVAAICYAVSTIRKLNLEFFSLAILLPSAFVLTLSALLLIDNFSNTMFGYGVAKTTLFTRGLYLAGFLFILFRISQRLMRFAKEYLLGSRYKKKFFITGVLAVIIPVLAFATASSGQKTAENNVDGLKNALPNKMPNIIFFATDGISAKLTSAYGNSNRTTPNLDKYVDESLFAEHAFTNSERTTGSTTSMLTGKYPATTKVLFPPHVLNSDHSYQHLPGLLKALGYRTMQESVRYYADANDINMLNSFDQVNGRTNEFQNHSVLSNLLKHSQHTTLFLSKVIERVSQRVSHIFFIEKMPDVYASITPSSSAKVYGLSDHLRIERGIEFIQNTDRPFFMHFHLMDSHCCNYRPKKKVFSNHKFDNKKRQKRALLEDSLKESDDYFGDIIQALKQSKKFDNTIIVYSSDHTENWGFIEPIPLLFIFPQGNFKGKISENVQLLDVAPTILDYLNVDIPKWMEGDSLLDFSISAQRPIYGITKLERERFNSIKNEKLSRIVGSGPPAYGLNTMAMTVCNQWYALDLNHGKIKTGKIKNHSDGCDRSTMPSIETAKNLIVEHLTARGFSIKASSVALPKQ